MLRPAIRPSISCQSSWLRTGVPSAFFQPRRFQLKIHFVMPFFSYWLSVDSTIGSRLGR